METDFETFLREQDKKISGRRDQVLNEITEELENQDDPFVQTRLNECAFWLVTADITFRQFLVTIKAHLNPENIPSYAEIPEYRVEAGTRIKLHPTKWKDADEALHAAEQAMLVLLDRQSERVREINALGEKTVQGIKELFLRSRVYLIDQAGDVYFRTMFPNNEAEQEEILEKARDLAVDIIVPYYGTVKDAIELGKLWHRRNIEGRAIPSGSTIRGYMASLRLQSAGYTKLALAQKMNEILVCTNHPEAIKEAVLDGRVDRIRDYFDKVRRESLSEASEKVMTIFNGLLKEIKEKKEQKEP